MVMLGLGILTIVAIVSALLSLFLMQSSDGEAEVLPAVAVAAPLTALGIGGTSAVKSSQIRSGGGSYLATSLGGWAVDFNTHDPAEKQLVNIVEEIAIASGMPVPAVFVLRDEPGINAFAAGWNSDNAVIGVTRGALQHLNRAELQGVIAHEFSHIANGDTKVKTRIIGWVFGIAALTYLGKVLFRAVGWGAGSRRRDGRQDARAVMVMVAIGITLIVIGSVGTWFARMIQAAVSRQREHLADASAVQYTRDPSGLAGALLKIGGMGRDNSITSAHAEEAGHLFFESPFRNSHATHPPLEQRIRALMPEWDGEFPRVTAVPDWATSNDSIADADGTLAGPRIPAWPRLARRCPAWVAPARARRSIRSLARPSSSAVQAVAPLAERQHPPDRAEHLHLRSTRTGSTTPARRASKPQRWARRPTPTSTTHASCWLASPKRSRTTSTPDRVRLPPSSTARLTRSSRAGTGTRAGATMTSFTAEYLDQASTVISSLDRPLQLPAIDIALHSIRETPPDYHDALTNVIRELESSSPDRDLFRWMLRRVMLRHLEDVDDNGRMRNDLVLDQLAEEAAIVYAVVSTFNSSGPDFAQGAFLVALSEAQLPRPASMPSGAALAVERVDASLDRLAHMTYDSRVAFVKGAIAAVRHDALTTADEAELIRVIADAVRLPMPPMLPVR